MRLGYAYTVLLAAEIGGGNKLLRLRGPLPAKEGWRGEWADDSPGWTQEALLSLRVVLQRQHGRVSSGESTAEEERGAFWVSIGEAVSSFAEVGVCMVPPTFPPSRGSSSSGGGFLRRNKHTIGVSGWAKEARKRVVFARKRARSEPGRGLRDGLAVGKRDAQQVDGRKKEKSGERGEDVGWCWASSQVYALSVYETSSMYFSVHQVYYYCMHWRRCDKTAVVCYLTDVLFCAAASKEEKRRTRCWNSR